MITKKEIKQFIQEIESSIFEVAHVGAYKKGNEVELYVTFRGQGTVSTVYNKEYDDIYDFTDNYLEYLSQYIELDDLVDIVHDAINYFFN